LKADHYRLLWNFENNEKKNFTKLLKKSQMGQNCCDYTGNSPDKISLIPNSSGLNQFGHQVSKHFTKPIAKRREK